MFLLDITILTQKEKTLAVEMLRFAPVISPKYHLLTGKRQWQFFMLCPFLSDDI